MSDRRDFIQQLLSETWEIHVNFGRGRVEHWITVHCGFDSSLEVMCRDLENLVNKDILVKELTVYSLNLNIEENRLTFYVGPIPK